MGRYDLFNRSGTPLCHYVGCRKNKPSKMIRSFRGLWCPNHFLEIKALRRIIKTSGDDVEVIEARIKEKLYRKTVSLGHDKFISHLLNKHR